MVDTERQSGEIPRSQKRVPVSKRAQLDKTSEAPAQSGLLDPRATALDQDNENNDKQHSGNNLNNRRTTHSSSSFLQHLA
jgi:hypothetical protein